MPTTGEDGNGPDKRRTGPSSIDADDHREDGAGACAHCAPAAATFDAFDDPDSGEDSYGGGHRRPTRACSFDHDVAHREQDEKRQSDVCLRSRDARVSGQDPGTDG